MQKKLKKIQNAQQNAISTKVEEAKSVFSTLYPALCKPFTVGAFTAMLAASLFYTSNALANSAQSLGLSGNTQTIGQGQFINQFQITNPNDFTYITQNGTVKNFQLVTAMYNYNPNTNGTTSLTNNGTIQLPTALLDSKNHNFAAIFAQDENVTVINNGNINASTIHIKTAGGGNVYAHASGIYAGGENITVANNGTITLNASGATDPHTTGFCINVNGLTLYGAGTVSNSGTINVNGTSGNSFVNTSGYFLAGDITATNHGTVNASATAYGYAVATGMDAYIGVPSLTNYGTLNAYAESSNSTAWAEGIAFSSTGTIVNQGLINAEAVTTGSSDARAYGIVQEYNKTSTGSMSNTGVINLSATSEGGGDAYMFQGYVAAGAQNAGVSVGTWAFTLRDYDNDDADGNNVINTVFGVGSNGKLNLNGAKLIVRKGEGTELGKSYDAENFVYIEGTGEVVGAFASATAELPIYVATLGGDNGSYATQTVTLTQNINAETSPGHQIAGIGVSNMQSSMNNLSTILANQTNFIGTVDATDTVEPHWRPFIMPYYSQSSNGELNYDTNMTGVAAGASYIFDERLAIGFHMNFGKANTEGLYLDSDAQAYTLGLHGRYNMSPELYVRGHVSGYLSQSDTTLTGTSGSSIRANVDSDTMGMFATLATGYDWALTPQHTITPELGLSYMYSKMDGFDANYATDGVNLYQLSYDAMDFDALYGEASLRWTGSFDLGEKQGGGSYGQLRPTVRLGVRQALTDAEVSSLLHFDNSATRVYSDANQSSFVTEAGLAWDLGDITTSLTYIGDFGDVEDSHMGMLKFSFAF